MLASISNVRVHSFFKACQSRNGTTISFTEQVCGLLNESSVLPDCGHENTATIMRRRFNKPSGWLGKRKDFLPVQHNRTCLFRRIHGKFNTLRTVFLLTPKRKTSFVCSKTGLVCLVLFVVNSSDIFLSLSTSTNTNISKCHWSLLALFLLYWKFLKPYCSESCNYQDYYC